MSISDCQCQYLKVNLATEVLAKQSYSQGTGTYELSENINGKPSWKSETHAIWYHPKFKTWFIGKLSYIGTSIAGIVSVDKNDISFVLRTTYKSLVWSNEFRPRKVTIKIGKATFSKDMNVWVDRKTVFLQTAKKGNFLKAFKTY